MRTLYNSLIGLGCFLQSVVLLGFRIACGLSFFFIGLGKLGNIEGVAGFFKQLGVPFPEAHAYFVASVEMVGGLLLVVGLASRLSALLLLITMTVAFLTAHLEAVMALFVQPGLILEESPFLYWLSSLIILAFGPGMLSLDALLKRFVFKSKL